MAETLVMNTPKRITIPSTSVYTEIILPRGTQFVKVTPGSNNLFISDVGSDGGALGADYMQGGLNITHTLTVAGCASIFAAASSVTISDFIAYGGRF